MSFIKKILGLDNLKKYYKIVEKINLLEKETEKLQNEEIKENFLKLKEELKSGKSLDDILPFAFALTREASKRTLKQRHFDVQLIGGIVLHEGKIAEMKTGEGKTLAATLPASLNALTEKGVHVITVNDYLAKRDTSWMGQIYHTLGLKVACLVHDGAYIYDPSYTKEKLLGIENEKELDEKRDKLGSFLVFDEFLRPISRKEAYKADIVYGTNHEFGFDYLRDNLVYKLEDKVHRGFYYAIIDEVDSILIDEARTPLIIAGPDEDASEYYKIFAKIVQNLDENTDYTVDEKTKTVSILDKGIEKVEKMLNISNLYAPENIRLVHFLEESLKAKALFKKDKDYIVRNNEVIIIDEFTGRMLLGRRYSKGLHQAIEAKENVPVKKEDRTYAQITIQNYFRLYEKIAGMTGTAETSAEEFHKVYNLDVVVIPTNKPMIRKDEPDLIFKTKKAKYEAVVKMVKEERQKGRPILIGTTSIENNEIISSYLSKAGIPHEVLNAKNHEKEGAIIAQAGGKEAVTVATNMAGRGVDIILGKNPPDPKEAEEIKRAGGLLVIGTERHEARRIDNQLRGRAGRQGDPGSTIFIISLEDDLLRIFGGEKLKNLMETLNVPNDMPIQSELVNKLINQAQIKVEGINFDIRKRLLEFDDVLNKQRTAIYKKRDKILEAGEKNEILPIIKEICESFVKREKEKLEIQLANTINEEDKNKILNQIEELNKKLEFIPEKIEDIKSQILAQEIVKIIDILWIDYLEELEGLREAVGIRAYGQHDPLVEYKREAHIFYKRLNEMIEYFSFNAIFQILELDIKQLEEKKEQEIKETNIEYKNVGRNDPCPCGSGKKYKKCHGR
jgi:preprotein translocase subunit SecA